VLALAAILLCAGAALPTGAQATNAARKNVRCKAQIVGGLTNLAAKQMRVRANCALQQASGSINVDADCMANPPDLGGTGTGSPTVDKQLLNVAGKALALAIRVGKRCDSPERNPETIGLHTLCPDPEQATDDWIQAVLCGYDLVRVAADNMAALSYRQNVGTFPMGQQELACRSALADRLRNSLRGRMRQRAACFRRSELGQPNLNCMATNAWPGLQLPTGFRSADRALPTHLSGLRNTIRQFCAFDLAGAMFTANPRINDPTFGAINGDAFTGEDLFHELADALIIESTRVMTTIYPGQSFCGDGVVDADNGEMCDTGIDGLTSCDGCDRDCTLSTCQNGAACGSVGESCDDGNTRSSDGCNASCELEFCGDGIIQFGLGETCDDSNMVDCDGCDSNCTPSNLCSNGIACASAGEECDLGLGICLRGFNELQPCIFDEDCHGSCESGPNTGKMCSTNTDCGETGENVCQQSFGCGGFCSGGSNNNGLCFDDSDCPGVCVAIHGNGIPCEANRDCPPGLTCNKQKTCVLPTFNDMCLTDTDCGLGGICTSSNGCIAGNSNSRGDTCRADCKLPACGDGAVDPNTDTNGLGGEECDDGNLVDGDGCDSNCTVTRCGNGVRTIEEECDLGPGTCVGGFDDGVGCLEQEDCRGFCFELNDIPCTIENAAIVCGGFSCITSFGCVGGNADGTVCRTNCTIPRCGDGILDPGEQCDDGPGVCIGGVDGGAQCTLPADCRGICSAGTLTGGPCLTSPDCGTGGICSLASCVGGNSDTVPGACPTDCNP